MDETEARAAMAEMEALLATLSLAPSISLGLPLRLTPSAWLFEAERDGAPVMLKRFLTPDAVDTVASMQVELDRVAGIFGDGDCQANRCLGAWPEAGLILLSHAPGLRLVDCIALAGPEDRARLLRHAGRWLLRLTEARQRQIGFGPRKWLQKLSAASDTALAPGDRGRLVRLRRALEDQAPKLRGLSVRQAATHGDYAGINAHYHDGVIFGVDMQGESWLAVARDTARFLVWQTLHDLAPIDRRIHGLRADDVTAFLDSGVLPAGERETVFPFFVGIELHRRFTETPMARAALRRMRDAVDGYVAGDTCRP